MALNKEFPRTPPERRAAYVYGHKLHSWFAAGSALLLVSVLWMLWQDYDREWKVYQRKFWSMKEQKFKDEYRAEYYRVEQRTKDLAADVAAAREALKPHEARLAQMESKHHLLERSDLYRAKQQQKFAKARLDTALNKFEEARKRHGAAHPEKYRDEQTTFEHWQKTFNARDEILKQTLGEYNTLAAEVAAIRAEVTRLRKDLEGKSIARDALFRNFESMGTSVANIIRDAPMLDFIDPNLKIEQRVIDDLKLDIYFAKVPIVDRCETCHKGIADPYWADADQPFAAHPRLDLYLTGKSPHPVESFGCTVCHRGRPPATEFVYATHTPGDAHQEHEWVKEYGWIHDHWWNRPMHPVKYTQASCLQCHDTAVELEGAEKLMRGKRLFRDFGCYGCHKAVNMEDVSVGGKLPRRGPSLRKLPSKTTKDWAHAWIWDPKHFRPSTRMPRFFGQDNNRTDEVREQAEVAGIVEYLWANAEAAELAPASNGNVERGADIVERIGCTGCHRITDPPMADGRTVLEDGISGSAGRNHGPELSRIAAKTTKAWLRSWLDDPQSHSPGTRMPRLRLTDQELADASEYLMTLDGGYVAPARPTVQDAAIDAILRAELGQKLPAQGVESELANLTRQERLEKVGHLALRKHGCAGCHDIAGFETEGKIGTDLYKQGSKPLTKLDFGLLGIGHGYAEIKKGSVDKQGVPLPHGVHHTLHDFLWHKLKNPRLYDWGKEKAVKDRLKMPNFEMTDDEAEAITTFILGMVEDPMSLHRKAGHTEGGPVAQASAKRYTEEQRGWWAIREYNCIACHRFEHERLTFKQTRDGEGVLQTELKDDFGTPKDPTDDVRGNNREVTVHGLTLNLDEDQVRSFQLWRNHEHLPSKRVGQNVFIPAGATVRHQPVIGEAIAEAYLRRRQRVDNKENLTLNDIRNQLPPSLVGEGHKVQAPWVFNFLKDVVPLRPWLELRMPSFDIPDGDARAIASFFAAKAWGEERRRITYESGVLAKLKADRKRLTDDQVDAAKAMDTKIENGTADLATQRAFHANPFPFERYDERTEAYLAVRDAWVRAQSGSDSTYLRRAWALMNDGDVKCFSCHFRDGNAPPGDSSGWAPDLKYARERLRPEWIKQWLHNPGQIQPGTKMPQFPWNLFGGKFPGSDDDRVTAVKDMLMNLDRAGKR